MNAAVRKVRMPHAPHPAAMVVAERLRKAMQAGRCTAGLRGSFVTCHGTALFSLQVTDEEIVVSESGAADIPRLVLTGSVAAGDLTVRESDEAGRTLQELINSPNEAWEAMAKDWWSTYASSRFMPESVSLIAADSNQRVDLGGRSVLSVTAATQHLVHLFTSRPLLPSLLAGEATADGPYPFIVAVNRALIDYHLGGNW